MHAEVVRCNLKAATGTGAGLFKDQGDVLALVQTVGDARLFLGLEVGRKIEQIADLLRREIEQFQKVSSLKIHENSPLLLQSLLCRK